MVLIKYPPSGGGFAGTSELSTTVPTQYRGGLLGAASPVVLPIISVSAILLHPHLNFRASCRSVFLLQGSQIRIPQIGIVLQKVYPPLQELASSVLS